jgi:hypothetical protein
MNILNLLLLSRNDKNALFYKENFPLDMFKLIYRIISLYEQICLENVKNDPFSIEFIENPSEQVQIEEKWAKAH